MSFDEITINKKSIRERERQRSIVEEDNKICIDDAKDFSGPLIQEEFWKRCNIQEHSIEVALVCGVCQSFFIAEVQTHKLNI